MDIFWNYTIYLFGSVIPCYNLKHSLILQRWPTEVPELQPAVKTLFDLLSCLGDRVLCAMALGLGLVS